MLLSASCFFVLKFCLFLHYTSRGISIYVYKYMFRISRDATTRRSHRDIQRYKYVADNGPMVDRPNDV